jgi:hypothetical protein
MHESHIYDLVKHLRTLPRKGAQTPMDKKDLKDITDLFKDAGKTLEDAVKKVSKETDLLVNAGIPAAINGFEALSNTFRETAQRMNFFDQQYGQLAKTLGVNTKAAAAYGMKLNEMAASFGAGAKSANAFAASISKILPFQQKQIQASTQLTTRLMNVNVQMTQMLGLTQDQANTFSLMNAESGKNIDLELAARAKMIESISDQNNLQIDFSQIMGDVLSLSEDIQVQYSRYPGNLEMAAVKARMMGIQLGKLNTVGNTLLDIESSISNEIELQILSGKRLVNQQGQSLTNLYREATLQGDAAKQADLLRQMVNEQGIDLEKNLFARRKMSQLLGVEEAELIRINKQEKLRKQFGDEFVKQLENTKSLDEIKRELEVKFEKEGVTEEQRAGLMKDALSVFDTRTADEKFQLKVESSLAVIVASLTKGQDISGKIGEAFKIQNDVYNSFDKLAKGVVQDEKTAGAARKLTAAAGAVSMASPTVKIAGTAVEKLLSGVPIGSDVANAINKVIEKGSSITALKPGSAYALTETTPSATTTKTNDAIIMGNKITPIDSKDQAYAVMKPGGAIDRAASNYNPSVSIDYTALASAVAAAMKNVSINVSAQQIASSIEYYNGQQLNA